ncbi:MAG: acyl-CoA carboxylase subunit epsilon [Micrococcales bacterium]
MSQNPTQTPHLSVVSGNPTAEELAVVVAVVQAAASTRPRASHPVKRPASSWHNNPGRLRTGLVPGHNQWRASFRSGLN